MRPRQTLVELFSSFLQFEGDRPSWLTDPRLQRSMQRSLEQVAPGQASEQFWALYWHKQWQHEPAHVCRNHLTAYGQEPCYWAAYKTATAFSGLQHGLADCFQMAIAQFDKVLKGFDAAQGTAFKSYAAATFASLIRETLRQRQEVDICTDWALLRKLSQKRLTESLQRMGLPSPTVQSYVLAWSSFKTLYAPQQATGTRKLPQPEPETWRAIAQFYNQERGSLMAATPNQLEQWLLACAKAARAYLYPTTVSINAPKPGQDDSEFLEDLPHAAQSSLLQEMIAEEEAQERQMRRSQLEAVLTTALHQLDAESCKILEEYYGQGRTQQELATALNTKQYTISRRLTRARDTLLKAVAAWMKDDLHIAPTSDLLKHTSTALEDWLMGYFNPAAIANGPSSLPNQPTPHPPTTP